MSDYRKQIVDELKKKPAYTADVPDYGQHPLIRDQERRGMPQAELSGYRPRVFDWARDTFGGENVQRVINDRIENPGKIISAPIVAAMGLVDGAKSAADGVRYFLDPATAPHPTDTRAAAMSARRAFDVASMVGTGGIGTTATAAAVGRPMVPPNALGTLISSEAKKTSKKRELPKNEYLSDEFNTPHPVERWSYVRKLMRSALRGENINPILYQGENLLAGVHRDAANALLNRLGKGKRIPKQNLDDLSDEDLIDLGINPDDLRRAVEDGDYARIDEIWDRK